MEIVNIPIIKMEVRDSSFLPPEWMGLNHRVIIINSVDQVQRLRRNHNQSSRRMKMMIPEPQVCMTMMGRMIQKHMPMILHMVKLLMIRRLVTRRGQVMMTNPMLRMIMNPRGVSSHLDIRRVPSLNQFSSLDLIRMGVKSSVPTRIVVV